MSDITEQLATATQQIIDEGSPMLDALANRLAAMIQSRAPRGKTGNLAKSIGVKKISPTLSVVRVTAPHSVLVEYGTIHAPPRAFIRPAVEELRAEVGQ